MLYVLSMVFISVDKNIVHHLIYKDLPLIRLEKHILLKELATSPI